ncbi:uncharacterized protein LOC143357622 [Halictus rubicundus]|uniref:uncharacterized protein LOC143357622 n=1 Tax=Halictus rubicundus TaxID=77578 RepID=UPI0040358F1E
MPIKTNRFHCGLDCIEDKIKLIHLCRKTEDLTSRDTDDDKCSLTTGTSVSLQDSTGSTITSLARSSYEHNFEDRVLYRQGGGRRYNYKKRKRSSENGIFSAPPGVSPHHVQSSIIRRNTNGSRLIFIWPQKPPKSRLLRILMPLMRGILIGCLLMDAVHFWPGEFLPTSLPSIMSAPSPPVKCNVIEPRWFDNS